MHSYSPQSDWVMSKAHADMGLLSPLSPVECMCTSHLHLSHARSSYKAQADMGPLSPLSSVECVFTTDLRQTESCLFVVQSPGSRCGSMVCECLRSPGVRQTDHGSQALYRRPWNSRWRHGPSWPRSTAHTGLSNWLRCSFTSHSTQHR